MKSISCEEQLCLAKKGTSLVSFLGCISTISMSIPVSSSIQNALVIPCFNTCFVSKIYLAIFVKKSELNILLTFEYEIVWTQKTWMLLLFRFVLSFCVMVILVMEINRSKKMKKYLQNNGDFPRHCHLKTLLITI